MLLLTCPWCGPRNETEYHYGGQAHVPYPENPADLDDRQWAEYVFYRDNPKGPFAERWMHGLGCRRWFNVLRDTVSYEVLAVYRLDEPRPELPAPRDLHQTAEAAGGNR
ncbi:sarcosine oxidase subunit delta [Streptomyces sp. NPDC101150]|uniref:sarcosine oxidase subunit delta n=1 Tax=Streptomyces sp. NPDC101150 TaxID=3366114 RepID=UPI0038189482